MLIKVISKIK